MSVAREHVELTGQIVVNNITSCVQMRGGDVWRTVG